MSVLAQDIDSEPTWSTPRNISQSGGSINPSIAVDASGQLFLFWLDEYTGVKYVSTDLFNWREPESVPFDFGGATPQFLTDSGGRIHAFWINFDGVLQTVSFVVQSNYEFVQARSPQILAQSALDFAILYDEANKFHLAYIRSLETSEFPAGIYYRASLNNSTSWEPGKLVQSSFYFRSAAAENANVQISASGNNVYLAWDDRPRRRIFLSHSEDAGASWEVPFEVDKPQAESDADQPYGVRLAAIEDTIMLFWQRRSSALSCEQVVQVSSDQGHTWDEPVTFFDQFSLCAEQADFLVIAPNLIILYAAFSPHIYFVPWNGEQWGLPQIQRDLANFENPDTLEPLRLACQQVAYYKSVDKLVTAGCSTGDFQDIWITHRNRGTMQNWFPSDSPWNEPVLVASNDLPLSNVEILIDPQNRAHATWEIVSEENPFDNSIHLAYSRLDDAGWTPPITILASRQEDGRHPSLASDNHERLVIAWENGISGELYFSWANADQADIPTEWSEPLPIPIPSLAATGPQMLVAPDGRYIIIYAIPLNEARGIYLVQSRDEGVTWSDPEKIFDGVSAGWEMVGNPRVDMSQDGQIHLLWARLPLPGTIGIESLYYMQSDPQIQTWMTPEAVTTHRLDWQGVEELHPDQLIRLWVGLEENRAVINYQSSQDDGSTWSLLNGQSISGQLIGEPSISTDPTGNLHVLHITQELSGAFRLHHWVWEDNSWRGEADLDLSKIIEGQPLNVAAAFSPQGKLQAIIGSVTIGADSGLPEYHQHYVERDYAVALEVSPITPAMPPASSNSFATETPRQTVLTPTASATLPSATPTSTPAGLAAEIDNRRQNTDQWSGAIVGGGIGIALVIGFLLARLVLARYLSRRSLG